MLFQYVYGNNKLYYSAIILTAVFMLHTKFINYRWIMIDIIITCMFSSINFNNVV